MPGQVPPRTNAQLVAAGGDHGAVVDDLGAVYAEFAPHGSFPQRVVGASATVWHLPGCVPHASRLSQARTPGTIYHEWRYATRPLRITDITHSVSATTTAGALSRIAVVRCDTRQQPVEVLWEGAELDVGTGGTYPGFTGLSITVPRGPFSFLHQVSANVTFSNGIQAVSPFTNGAIASAGSSGQANPMIQHGSTSRAYGPLGTDLAALAWSAVANTDTIRGSNMIMSKVEAV